MKLERVLIYILTNIALVSVAWAIEKDQEKTVQPQAPFAHLVDVDYGFFMTKTKLPWGIDPFQKEPGFAKVPPVAEKLVLTGILFSKDQPSAIINGKSVGPGDLVGDRHVQEIGENYVILKKLDSEIELNLTPLREPASIVDEEEGEE